MGRLFLLPGSHKSLHAGNQLHALVVRLRILESKPFCSHTGQREPFLIDLISLNYNSLARFLHEWRHYIRSRITHIITLLNSENQIHHSPEPNEQEQEGQ